MPRAVRISRRSWPGSETSPVSRSKGDSAVSPGATGAFLERKIPAVHFNTGLYPEYHHADDTVDRVDYDGGAKVAAIGGQFVDALTTHEGPLVYRKLDPSHDIQHAIRLVSALGAIPNVRAQEGRYPQVLFVRPGSPAAKLGVHAGDELAEIDGVPIERVEDAVSLVPRLRFDRAIPVKFLRDGAAIDVTFPAEVFASFAGPSVRPLADGEHYEVTFRFVPPRGTRRVTLAGSFNDWSLDALPMAGPDGDGHSPPASRSSEGSTNTASSSMATTGVPTRRTCTPSATNLTASSGPARDWRRGVIERKYERGPPIIRMGTGRKIRRYSIDGT